MKILLTGGSGFLGSIIRKVLKDAEIITVGRHAADITSDLSTEIPGLFKTDLVIHSAGKAHLVPKTPVEKQAFFDVNVRGTSNLLKALEGANLPEKFVFISSVAVYGRDTGVMINEDEPLLAQDPYGKSKIEAEQLVANWCKAHNVICTILRLPLIAGKNPPGNLGAMINGIKKGYYVNIDGGVARKSIVLGDDVARIIQVAAEKGGIYNLTDGVHPSFKELSDVLATQLGKSRVRNIPLWFAKIIAAAGNLIGNAAPLNSSKLTKIISDLTFDDSKARKAFGWAPNPAAQSLEI